MSPYNLVRVILGERTPSDSAADNVYTRAAGHLNDWIASGILAREREPGIFPYFQEFTVPDTGERLVRKGFIALGAVEDYSAGVVHRHEQTLSGPKKDRLELLRHTHAHFGQLFMLYPDPQGAIDALLDQAAAGPPLAEVTDEYGAVHRLWKIAEPRRRPGADGGQEAAHRRRPPPLRDRAGLPQRESRSARRRSRHDDLRQHVLARPEDPGHPPPGERPSRRGIPRRVPAQGRRRFPAWTRSIRSTACSAPGTNPAAAPSSAPPSATASSAWKTPHARGELDVRILHERLLGKVLGIGEEAVRDEQHLRYIRGLDAAVEEARKGAAQIAFLLKPTSVQQVADTSFAGGVMPQKSTDFYPKLLSGLTIYKLE